MNGISEAYALGVDARGRDEPITANPYDHTGNHDLHQPYNLDWLAWRNGWQDADFDANTAGKADSHA